MAHFTLFSPRIDYFFYFIFILKISYLSKAYIEDVFYTPSNHTFFLKVFFEANLIRCDKKMNFFAPNTEILGIYTNDYVISSEIGS